MMCNITIKWAYMINNYFDDIIIIVHHSWRDCKLCV